MKLCMCNFHDHSIVGCWIISPWTCKFYWIIVVQRNNPTVLHLLNSNLHTMLLVVYSSACAIFIKILSLVAELSPRELINFTKSLLSTALLLHLCKYCPKMYTVCIMMKLCICNFHVRLSFCLSICPWTQFCQELFSVLHILLWNLYIMFLYIWSCACAIFMTILLLVVELSSLELESFIEFILLSREIILQYCMYWTQLHTVLLVVYSSACAILIIILSLFAELSPLELVNFTKSLLSRALLLHFCKYCSENYTMFVCKWSCVYAIFMSVCPWTQFCLELPLLNHSPICDQNLLYDSALVGSMISFSDSSSLESNNIWMANWFG